MAKDTMIRVRLDAQDKEKLELMSAYYGDSMSNLIRNMIICEFNNTLTDMKELEVETETLEHGNK